MNKWKRTFRHTDEWSNEQTDTIRPNQKCEKF